MYKETFHPRLKSIDSCFPKEIYLYHTVSPLRLNPLKDPKNTIDEYTLESLQLVAQAIVFIVEKKIQDLDRPSADAVALIERQKKVEEEFKNHL